MEIDFLKVGAGLKDAGNNFFKAFLDYALNLGADKISTGHYARITQENEIFQLKVGLDNNKDQPQLQSLVLLVEGRQQMSQPHLKVQQ
jgi:tRNA U34 2-thiouridine synthase MnmA/TrmU